MVHGYVVHSVLASYIIMHVVCTCKQEGGGVIVRSYDKSRDNAPPPTLVAYAGLQKTVHVLLVCKKIWISWSMNVVNR